MVTLFLCGDVMTGRGVDQVLGHPGDPGLREPYCRDARDYVALAEGVNGAIPRPVEDSWLWGDVLGLLDDVRPDVRVINLETSVTAAGEFAPGKGIHYRMHPANVGCLAVAKPDVCVLANNHVLDFGRDGLADTLDTLAGAGLGVAGAGRDEQAAWRPAEVGAAGGSASGSGAAGVGTSGSGAAREGAPRGGRVVVLAAATSSAGVGPGWAAGPDRSGVAYLPILSGPAADGLLGRVRTAHAAGGLVVVSLHWGPNWGYDLGEDEVRFAHQLVDAGASVVHGHSAHHARPIEVHQGKLILYGCGDFIDDYEGISGYHEYRDDLRLAYLATLDDDSGKLGGLRIAPYQAKRMRLEPADDTDTRWLADLLTRISRRFGTVADVASDGSLALRQPPLG